MREVNEDIAQLLPKRHSSVLVAVATQVHCQR